jgi:hypothetical protein
MTNNPKIGITEDDFTALAYAANAAYERGNFQDAATLDRLARKANSALANRAALHVTCGITMGHRKGLKWQEVPTTLPRDLASGARHAG